MASSMSSRLWLAFLSRGDESRVLEIKATSLSAVYKILSEDYCPLIDAGWTTTSVEPKHSHGGSRPNTGSVSKHGEPTKVVRVPQSIAQNHFDKIVAIPELLEILKDYRSQVAEDNLKVYQGLKKQSNPRLDGLRKMLGDLEALGF